MTFRNHSHSMSRSSREGRLANKAHIHSVPVTLCNNKTCPSREIRWRTDEEASAVHVLCAHPFLLMHNSQPKSLTAIIGNQCGQLEGLPMLILCFRNFFEPCACAKMLQSADNWNGSFIVEDITTEKATALHIKNLQQNDFVCHVWPWCQRIQADF